MELAERLKAGKGGWVRLMTSDDPEAAAFARMQQDDSGRLTVRELYFAPGSGPISTESLRRIPLGRIEAMANSPEMKDSILKGIDNRAPDLRTAASYYATRMAPGKAKNWAERMIDPSEPPARPKSHRTPPPPKPIETRIAVPSAGRYPNDFYAAVAEAYSGLAERTQRPAAALAEENGVPVTTVHRWVREARNRGLLGAGRRGVAG